MALTALASVAPFRRSSHPEYDQTTQLADYVYPMDEAQADSLHLEAWCDMCKHHLAIRSPPQGPIAYARPTIRRNDWQLMKLLNLIL